MTFTVMIVCSANICRSPLTAALLDRALRGHLVRHHLEIRSCGLAATPGTPVCPEMAGLLARAHETRHRLSEHRATLASPAALAGADLTLTADRHARAGVVRMFPQAHGRVFTVREAGQLAEQLRGQLPQPPPGESPSLRQALPEDIERRLREFVCQLDAQRGLGDLVRTERQLTLSAPWRPLEIQGHDVPDAHLDHRVRHRLVLRLAEPPVTQLAEALTAFTAIAELPGPRT